MIEQRNVLRIDSHDLPVAPDHRILAEAALACECLGDRAA
jgi:hypothetical protein